MFFYTSDFLSIGRLSTISEYEQIRKERCKMNCKTNLILRLEKELHTALKLQVVREHTTLQAYVIGLILADQARRHKEGVS